MSSDPTTVPSDVSPIPRPTTPPPEKRVISSILNDPSSPSSESTSSKKQKTMEGAGTTLPSISGMQMSGLLNPTTDHNNNNNNNNALPSLPSMNTTTTSLSSGGPQLLVKKLNEKARAPTRGSAHAAGYDLYASEDCVVPKGGKYLVETGLSMAVPDGCYGRVAPRSGLASKNFIDVGAGVIDSDYRGPVKILLFNHSDVDFEVKEGDRVAQLILERIYTPEVMVVESLEESVRGAGGFGSSGR